MEASEGLDEDRVPSTSDDDSSSQDAGSEAPDGLEDLEDLGDVEIDRNLLSVDITIPVSFFEGDDPQGILDAAQEQRIEEATVHPDGSVTYRMSRGQHREMLAELRASISESLDEMVGEFGSVLAIDHNADFTEIDMRVDRQAYENSLDSFALFGIAIGAGFDQHFSGADGDSYRVVVTTIDDGTDGFFDTFVLPDDWQ